MKRILVKLADRNEEMIPKCDCWMKKWIWWIVLPMALWLIIGAMSVPIYRFFERIF